MKLNRRIVLGTGIAATSVAAIAAMTGLSATEKKEAGAPVMDAASPLGEKWLGREDAPVSIIEYASATCPHCANFHKDTYPLLKSEFIDTGKVRFAMREFPLDDLSLAAFMVARCAPEDRYFPVVDVLFERQQVWTRNDPRGELLKIARQAGMTEKDFEACLANKTIGEGIVQTRNQAQSKLGVNSTPTFFINGQKVAGIQPIEYFRRVIGGLIG